MRFLKALIYSLCIITGYIANAQNITTATNGLTKVGSNTVKLGGTNALTENTSVDLGASFYFNLKKGSSNYFTVLNGGNVGIGILAPTQKLDVNGIIKTTGLLFPTGAAAGKILASDASGNAGWTSYTTGYIKSNGTALISSATVTGSDISGNISGYAANVTGTIAIANGGTGATTQNGALNSLLPSQSGHVGKFLQTDGTNASWVANSGGGGSGWMLLGNAGTTGSNFIGTTDNQPLIFKTNNTETGKILADGDLLIGTTTDNGAYKIQTTIPASGNGLFVDGSVNAGVALKVKAKDQTWAWHAENGIAQIGLQNQISGSAWTLDAVNTTFSIVGRSANIQLATDAFADILILPGKKLKVNLGSDATGDIYYRNGTGDFTRLAAGTNGQVLTLTSGLPSWANSSGGSSQWTTAASNIYYNTGKVGIGTTNLNDANYKLFVEGAIRSRKIRVDQLAWPDYVFHYHYKLRSLKEVEEFIKLNNHLPDVPSAKEIEKEGLDLGDNQAVLLKKIEELTLYLIDQDKKMQELQKQNAELKEIKTQLELLKKMIEEKK